MARTRSRMHRRYSKNPAPRSNPPLFTDLLEFAAPGFLGFSATRFLSFVAATQVAKRKPSWGKHIGAIAAGGSFLTAWLVAHRVRALEKYHTPIVVGSFIAMLQTLFQLYLPPIGWMLADPTPHIDQAKLAADQGAGQLTELHQVHLDPNEYTYTDMFDPGRLGKAPPAPRPGTGKVPPAQPAGQTPPIANMSEDEIIADAIGGDNEYGDGMGVFTPN